MTNIIWRWRNAVGVSMMDTLMTVAVVATVAAIAAPSADLPPAALTALPVTVMAFAAAAAIPSDAHARPAAFPGASPPLLQFCRLLI